MNENISSADVVMIGAGPVGLFGVFACGMLGLKTSVIDILPHVGGQCTALYPHKPIYDIPGYPTILAGDLIKNLESQAAPFNPQFHLGHALETITQDPTTGLFTATAGPHVVTARAVLIASGAGAFGPNRPPIPGIEAYENQSVFYAVKDPARFHGRRIAIVGGGDSAVDWANILAPHTAKLYFIHRRPDFRAAPASVADLKNHMDAGRVTPVIPGQLTSLHGADGQLQAITLKGEDDQTQTIKVDDLLCFFGLSTRPGTLSTLGLHMDHNHIVIDPTTGATNLPGFFAAGDGVTYPHKQKLILTGFAEISAAAAAIDRFINPNTVRAHVHSTTKGVPGTTAT